MILLNDRVANLAVPTTGRLNTKTVGREQGVGYNGAGGIDHDYPLIIIPKDAGIKQGRLPPNLIETIGVVVQNTRCYCGIFSPR